RRTAGRRRHHADGLPHRRRLPGPRLAARAGGDPHAQAAGPVRPRLGKAGVIMAVSETIGARAAATQARPRFSSDLQQVWIGVALIAITGFGPSIVGNSYWVHTFQLVNIYIAAAIFQNFLFVDAGQKSFGQGV